MARTSSFDAQFDKARASAGEVEALCLQLSQSTADASASSGEPTLDEDTAQPGKLIDARNNFAADCLRLLQSIAAQIDEAYAAFDRADEVTRRQRLVGFFTRQPRNAFKAARQKRLGIAEGVKTALGQAAAVSDLLRGCKATFAHLAASCDARLETCMETRSKVILLVDEARRRDRELAASLATLERKIGAASDEAQQDRWKTERAEASSLRDEVLVQRKRLSEERALLDRQAILLGDIIDALNDGIAVCTLLLNALAIEAERCIMLFAASYGSLQPLLDDVQHHSETVAEGADPAPPLGVFHELLALHGKGAVTMQDVEKRKTRIADALAQRFQPSQPAIAKTAAGKT